jgi:TonB family protein
VRFCRLFPSFVVALLAATALFTVRAQDRIQPQNQDGTGKQAEQLKLIKSPMAPYPYEALKKNIEGKVTLRIAVDAAGRVSDAEILSGPSELFQAALDSVKQWEFEPPIHAPVLTNAEVLYGHPRECPGPVSENGEVMASYTLRSEKGTIVEVRDDPSPALPEYFPEDRKAGVTGVMVLSVTVNAKGKVTSVRVVKSLSPHLDNAAVNWVRALRFKLLTGNPDSLPDDFPLHIVFRPTCHMEF